MTHTDDTRNQPKPEPTTEARADRLRATYDEFTDGDAFVAVITDPENPQAWIQSDTVQQIRT